MKHTLILLVILITQAPLFAATTRTDSDSVPGTGKGWFGVYYTLTPYLGTVIDGKGQPFIDKTWYSHSVMTEGAIGFFDSLCFRVNLPYTYDAITAEGKSVDSDGFGDLRLSLKWGAIRGSGPRLAAIITSILPTGDEGYTTNHAQWRGKLCGGVPMGNGRLLANLGYTYTPETTQAIVPGGSYNSFNPGDSISMALAYEYRINDRLSLPLELISTLKGRDRSGSSEVEESGYTTMDISPTLSYKILPELIICAGVQIPLVQNGWLYDYGVAPHLTGFYCF